MNIDWEHEYKMLERAYRKLYLANYRRKYNLHYDTKRQIKQMLDDAVVFAIMAEESIIQKSEKNKNRSKK